jgi:hypothetical protein
VLSVVNDFGSLKRKCLISLIENFAEIMPDSLAAKSAEIIDSCVLSEIVFTGMFVNKNKQ